MINIVYFSGALTATMNKCLCLLIQLRRQGLSIAGLTTAFLTLMVASLQYPLPDIGGFSTADDISRINVVFVKAIKLDLTTTASTTSDLLEKLRRNHSWQRSMTHIGMYLLISAVCDS